MGVRITSGEKVVAIFCSTTGFAFGPVFDTEQDALDFLEHVHRIDGRDPRALSENELRALHRGWARTREAAA